MVESPESSCISLADGVELCGWKSPGFCCPVSSATQTNCTAGDPLLCFCGSGNRFDILSIIIVEALFVGWLILPTAAIGAPVNCWMVLYCNIFPV